LNKKMCYDILSQNMNRDLCLRWFFSIFPLILTIIIIFILDYFTHLISFFGLGNLPSSDVKIGNIIPALFTGTITAGSILLGFFSVSAYNFYHSLADSIEKSKELRDKNDDALKTQHQEKQNLEKKGEKVKNDQLIGVKEDIKLLESKIGKSIEAKELIMLNTNALAHEQEHLCKFMVNFLKITVGLLLSAFIIFVFSSIPFLQALMAPYAFFSLYSIFVGLVLFLRKFMAWEGHREINELTFTFENNAI
jgi:hypothetical protein